MWVSQEELERIGELAQTDDKLLSMLVEWNENMKDWGLQDQIMCKIINYVKEKESTDEAKGQGVL